MSTKYEFYPPAALKLLGAASKHIFVGAVFAAALAFAGCPGGSDDDDVYVPVTPDPELPKTVTEHDLTPKILAPVSGGTLAVSFHPTQYDLDSVLWTYTEGGDPVDGDTFAPGGTYTVTAKLRPIKGWNLNNVTKADFFEHAYAEEPTPPQVASVNAAIYDMDESEEPSDEVEVSIPPNSNPNWDANEKVVIIHFVPAKTTVNSLDLGNYITVPVKNAAPETNFSDDQYTAGTVTWAPPVSETFEPATAYNATFTLTAEEGYTFVGIPAKTSEAQVTGAFTHQGGTVTHGAGVQGTLEVTIGFPATDEDDSDATIKMPVEFD